jgi:hypothetical protein
MGLRIEAGCDAIGKPGITVLSETNAPASGICLDESVSKQALKYFFPAFDLFSYITAIRKDETFVLGSL